jgi:hypothetical protein
VSGGAGDVEAHRFVRRQILRDEWAEFQQFKRRKGLGASGGGSEEEDATEGAAKKGGAVKKGGSARKEGAAKEGSAKKEVTPKKEGAAKKEVTPKSLKRYRRDEDSPIVKAQCEALRGRADADSPEGEEACEDHPAYRFAMAFMAQTAEKDIRETRPALLVWAIMRQWETDPKSGERREILAKKVAWMKSLLTLVSGPMMDKRNRRTFLRAEVELDLAEGEGKGSAADLREDFDVAMAKLKSKVSEEKFVRFSANTPEIADGVREEIERMVSAAYLEKGGKSETRPDWLFLLDK